MSDKHRVSVVIAAGGLGSRVHHWARYLPKEFAPVDGRPGITWLLQEIADLGPAQIVVVYNPYYENFIAWARHVLSPDAHTCYRRATGRPVGAGGHGGELALSFVAQDGPYADLTSLINGADHLQAADEMYLAYADNLYTGDNPLLALSKTPADQIVVLARPFRPDLASHRGVIVTTTSGGHRLMAELVEKPTPATVGALERCHGIANLLLLEGRMRVTGDFVRFARTCRFSPGTEPKIALTLGAYAATHPVQVVETASDVIDLGSPNASTYPGQVK